MFCSCCAGEEAKGQVDQLDDVPATGAHQLVQSIAVLNDVPAKGMDGYCTPIEEGSEVDDDADDFELVVQRAELTQHWGIIIDPSGNRVFQVCSFEQGASPVTEANRKASAGERLRVGDFILEVNGIASNVNDIMRELMHKKTLLLRIRRPFEFEVIITKQEGGLGCSISYDPAYGISLVIDGINEGPVTRWNSENAATVVRLGDRIVAINGQRGTAAQLLDIIKASEGKISLLVARPCTINL